MGTYVEEDERSRMELDEVSYETAEGTESVQ